MNYLFHIGVMIGIYGMLTYSMNLLTGFGGLLTLTQAAFYGMGAYVYALLGVHFGIPFYVSIPCAVIFCGLVGWLLGLAVLRFRNETFVLATLGFQMIVFVILYNWIDLTKGPYGITGIPRPSIMGWEIDGAPQFFIFTTILFALYWLFFHILYKSPFALSLKALRDDELAAQTMGISPRKQYVQAMIVSSAFSAIPGACFAGYVTYIDPTSFTLQESIFIAAILLVGGSGNKTGPMCGVLFMILLPEILRFVGIPDAIAANMREIIYGTLLIVLMYLRPQGLAGAFAAK